MVKNKPRAKFLSDEDFPSNLGKFLKSQGLAIREFPPRLRGRGIPDGQVLQRAIKVGCILLTKDRDFLHDEQFTEMIQSSLGIVRFVNPPPGLQARERIAKQFLTAFSESHIAGKVLEIKQTTHRYITPKRKRP